MTDWPVRSLGEVCDFVRGVTYDKADARSEIKSGFIPLLRATNITEKGLLREDFVFIPKNGVRADQKLMSGDALITIASGSASVVGRSVLVEDPGEMTFGAFCGVLRPSPEILPRYLSHFMSSRSVRAAWSEAAQGTNINNLKRDDILQTECLLPPLEEQKRIVELLDSATAHVTELTACYEQARTHANDLFTSALRDALESNPDWPVKTLGEICQIEMGRTPSRGDSKGWDKEMKTSNHWASIADLTACRGRVLSSTKERISDFAARTTKVVPTGTLVMSFKLSIGKLAFAGCDLYTNEAIAAFHLPKKSEVDSEFLYWALMVVDWASLTKGSEKVKGATMNKAKLNVLEIAVPPLEEQKKIIMRLDSIQAKTSEMVAAYDAKLQAAKDLRQSILEAAFAGDL